MAIIMVLCIVAPQYISAAEYVEKTINLEIESEYQDDHDEVVNVANESSIKNPDTWDPAPQGIWLGASTQESLFEFDVVATYWNIMKIASVVKFNRTQIMNGASEFIIRSPIASDNLVSLQLRILKFTDDPVFSIISDGSMPLYENADAIEIAVIDIDIADISITGGSDSWTVDGRTYVLVRCPIYSGINYAFIWNAKLVQDASFQVYMSGQDICNDNITDTRIYYSTRPFGDTTIKFDTTLAIDPGISFDLLTGLGNGVFANSIYLDSGDSVSFRVDTNSPFSGYQTIMVPFGTSDGTLDANITVLENTISSSPDVLWWSNNTWTNYILACSSTNMSGAVASSVIVRITVWEDVRVNWIFADSPTGSIISRLYNMAVFNMTGIEHTVHSRLWFSYQESVAPIFPPSMDPADFPAYMFPETNQRGNWYGTIIGVIMVVVGGAMIATGFLAPVGFVLAGSGALMIIADIAKDGHLWGGGPVAGWMRNAMDKIREFLDGIGEFLLSIGEGLWDAITWLVDAIVEIGSYLIGMILIAVAMFIFFYFFQYQLRLWSFAWAMADGNLRAAGREANGLLKETSRALRSTVRVASKVDRRVKVANKAYNKWQKRRQESKEEEGGDDQ